MRLRWAVNVGAWDPSPPEFAFLLDLLRDESERLSILRYRMVEDQRRALVSRLLQLAACGRALGVPSEAVRLERTKGGKPFASEPQARPIDAPNFNFSVSHEGSYVVLASESLCLVGVDVAAPQELRPGRKSTATELLRTFRSQLTAREAETIADISAARGDAEALRAFQDVWALKEAYAKALGLGLACDLTEVSFEDAIARQREAGLESRVVAARFQTRKGGVVAAASDASRRSGSLPPWSFHLHALPGAHAVAVARGAPAAAVDAKGAFKGTFIEPTPSHERLQAALEESDPPFALLTMSDLVPEALHGAYEAAGGEIV